MKGLNWFQARSLATRERRAIRREGWEHWILYRSKLWLLSEQKPAGESRRVTTTNDFRDSEFLAKDWTDEPWPGGSKPPCTNEKPSIKVPTNDRGGSGLFTLSDFCGGAGEGGGVLPPALDPSSPSNLHPVTVLAIANNSAAVGTELLPLTPDGAGCWVTPPTTFGLIIAGSFGDAPIIYYAKFSWSLSGADLSGDVPWLDAHPNADTIASDPGGYSFGAFGTGGNFAVQIPGVAYTPGDTITVRVDFQLTDGSVIYATSSLTLPELCA